MDKIPLDDPRVYELLNNAEVIGLFQLDGGMAKPHSGGLGSMGERASR